MVAMRRAALRCSGWTSTSDDDRRADGGCVRLAMCGGARCRGRGAAVATARRRAASSAPLSAHRGDLLVQLTVHHVAFDGASTGVFLGELRLMYERMRIVVVVVVVWQHRMQGARRQMAVVRQGAWRQGAIGHVCSCSWSWRRCRLSTSTTRCGSAVRSRAAPRVAASVLAVDAARGRLAGARASARLPSSSVADVQWRRGAAFDGCVGGIAS